MLQGEEFKMAPVTAAIIFMIAGKREAYSSHILFTETFLRGSNGFTKPLSSAGTS